MNNKEKLYTLHNNQTNEHVSWTLTQIIEYINEKSTVYGRKYYEDSWREGLEEYSNFYLWEEPTAENLLEIITENSNNLNTVTNGDKMKLNQDQEVWENCNESWFRIKNVLRTPQAFSVYKWDGFYKQLKQARPDFGLSDKQKQYIKIIFEFDVTLATLAIGSDHGITPQAEGAIKELRERIEEVIK